LYNLADTTNSYIHTSNNMAEDKVQTFDIPKTCKAGVVVNEGPDFRVEVQDVPVPECGTYWKTKQNVCKALTAMTGPTDVLIKLNATGICHSDLHFMLNDWALPKMSDLGTKCAGHEGSGVIVKVGDQVKNLKPGMRAGYKVSKLAVHVILRGKEARARASERAEN
jgi:hypothetical protein